MLYQRVNTNTGDYKSSLVPDVVELKIRSSREYKTTMMIINVLHRDYVECKLKNSKVQCISIANSHYDKLC